MGNGLFSARSLKQRRKHFRWKDRYFKRRSLGLDINARAYYS